MKPHTLSDDIKQERRDRIERANLRHMLDHPEALSIFRDECGLEPKHFKNPHYRRAYESILVAAANGLAIQDDVLALLTARDGER